MLWRQEWEQIRALWNTVSSTPVLGPSSSTPRDIANRNTHIQSPKNIHKSVLRGMICNSPKLETNQVSTNSTIMVFLSWNTTQQQTRGTTAAHKADEAQNLKVEQQEPDTKEHTQYEKLTQDDSGAGQCLGGEWGVSRALVMVCFLSSVVATQGCSFVKTYQVVHLWFMYLLQWDGHFKSNLGVVARGGGGGQMGNGAQKVQTSSYELSPGI